MICGRDDDDDVQLSAVAINSVAYICRHIHTHTHARTYTHTHTHTHTNTAHTHRDLGVERFAPFLQSCITVTAQMLATIPTADDDDGDDRCGGTLRLNLESCV